MVQLHRLYFGGQAGFHSGRLQILHHPGCICMQVGDSSQIIDLAILGPQSKLELFSVIHLVFKLVGAEEDRDAVQEVEEAERPQRPGPVDTTVLTSQVADDRLEGIHFTFKSPQTWQLLERMYPGSGPPLPRTLLPGNKAHFYQRNFKVHRYSDATAGPITFKVPRDVRPSPTYLVDPTGMSIWIIPDKSILRGLTVQVRGIGQLLCVGIAVGH
jgi:hypothetical protein